MLRLEDIIEIVKNENLLKSTWRFWIKNRLADPHIVIYKDGRIAIAPHPYRDKELFAIVHFHYIDPVNYPKSLWKNGELISPGYFSWADVRSFKNLPVKYIGIVYHKGRKLMLNIYKKEDVKHPRPKPVKEEIIVCKDFFELKRRKIRKIYPTQYDPKSKEFKEYVREKW